MDKYLLINQLESKVEMHLQVAISRFQNLTDDVLLKPSATGGWSIAQCLEHLNSYGVYYIPLFEKGVEEGPEMITNRPFKSTWLGRLAIDSMNPTTGKRKFKAFKKHSPVLDLDATAVIAEFISHQERLLQILRKAKSKDIQKIKIPISIARFLKLNMGDALQFLIVHNERHIQQAKKNL